MADDLAKAAGAPDPPEPTRRPVSLRQVADRARVAVATASRVLSDSPGVRPELRHRVLTAAEDLGYEPNMLAQSLRSGASFSVGFVVRDISSPVLSEIALGAERTLRSSGYALSLTNSEGLPSLDAEYIRFFRRRRVDGLLLSVADEAHIPMLDELRRLRVPFVSIDRDLPASFGGAAVLSDHGGGVRTAARWLSELGHRRIGLVTGLLSIRAGRECAIALTDFCREQFGTTPLIEAGSFTREHGESAVTRLMASPDRPTAIIAGSVQILIGVLQALWAHGLHVPNDISVVTFDESDFLEIVKPPISVISRNPLMMGEIAADLLLRRIGGADAEQITVPTTLRQRASCAPPRTN